MTLYPKVGAARIDIGLLERDIWFAVSGTQERQARVKGMVRGSVWLDDNNTQIDLGGYPGSAGLSKPVTLITAQPDLAVTLISDECTPKFLQVKLEKDPNPPSRDRGYYKLTIRLRVSRKTRICNTAHGMGTGSGGKRTHPATHPHSSQGSSRFAVASHADETQYSTDFRGTRVAALDAIAC